MPKRKATNKSGKNNNKPEDEEVDDDYDDKTACSQNVLRETQLDETVANKRKRVSQGLDLTKLNDIQNAMKVVSLIFFFLNLNFYFLRSCFNKLEIS